MINEVYTKEELAADLAQLERDLEAAKATLYRLDVAIAVLRSILARQAKEEPKDAA